MRVYEEIVAPSGKKRILFAVGIEDIKIMAGLVAKAKTYTPKIDDNHEILDLHQRLSSMARGFRDYLSGNEKKPLHPKQNPCPFCERKLRGEKALEMHINKVHSTEVKA